MPVDASRRIKVARLRAESEPLIRRGALLLEEALRTASLPGAQDRLLLIRSLSLGVLRLDKSAVVMSQQLECQIAEFARHAVHGTDPRAATAEAVFFYDRLDAILTLIQRLAQGASGDGGRAWYWRRAVPGWEPDVAPPQAGRLLLGLVLNVDQGTRSLAQAFQRLVETGSLDLLLHAVREQDGTLLLQRCGWGDRGHATTAPPIPSPAAYAMPFPQAWRSILSQWVIRWGPSDARSLWLMMFAVQSWWPEKTAPAEIRAQAEVLLPTIPGVIDRSLASPASGEHVLRHRDVEPDRTVQSEEPAIVEPASGREGAPVHTVYAGFWFLIPLLMRAGFGRAVEEHPEWIDAAVPHRLLSSVANRLAIPLDDPVRLWLSQEGADESGDKEPGCDREFVGDIETIVAAWRISMRRWCRLHARLGLADLVRRPGWVLWNKTHVEVRISLSHVDLRIRRAGLDLDPGWVSWLGQVVRFYYDAEGRSHGTGGIAGH